MGEIKNWPQTLRVMLQNVDEVKKFEAIVRPILKSQVCKTTTGILKIFPAKDLEKKMAFYYSKYC
jgi:hypothetical protein